MIIKVMSKTRQRHFSVRILGIVNRVGKITQYDVTSFGFLRNERRRGAVDGMYRIGILFTGPLSCSHSLCYWNANYVREVDGDGEIGKLARKS